MQRSVSEFIVVVPPGASSLDGLAGQLERFFPRYRFYLDPPMYGADFGVIPVVGKVGEGEWGDFYAPAPAADVHAIVDLIRSFGAVKPVH